ncbi:oligopeptide ABC transporter ATP-binding protein [Lacticaseibacillus zeae DSM 20178 = KCTC 3804]|uniref:ABC transporter ATP-binding protein n=2 Tax=Lacticaseibacillus zeae TaxID=57037 RepID=A0A5R8LQD5_LACZE|nr:ATP-binding cassette domain-containing protein [Lacticaseibacillus zeae]KRK12229.1 oligopeptide ABC transporter ATP-binding protein [Lacticaseibacillus zeae DSM 20178 = KCTC 3804]OLS09558.1 peptide ABC transporter ATP-binding protein [Lacticaseibacillus casei]QVI31073.1 ABC transporter ATP-binding protein [Lacticaseibacillus zeae]TLF39476.1 ABC transporter ATP-binding protein [Lacticaseibacillus zeae]
MTEPLFAIQDLSVNFRKDQRLIKAVNHINFTIASGTTVGLVGESGSGKTTTGRAIAGIGPISGGDVLFSGESIQHFSHAERKQFRRQVQMVFQDPFASLNPRQKVADIIAEGIDNFHLASSTQERIDRVLQLLEQVGLPPDAINRFPHEFSGGQRQRIGIARALAVEPKFLVLDEPISALDVSIQAQIVNLLRQIQQAKHLTYLFIAHDLSMVHYISDQIVVMYQGQIVETGATEAVYRHPLHPYTQTLLASVPQADPLFEQQKPRVQFDRTPIPAGAALTEAAPDHWVLAP